MYLCKDTYSGIIPHSKTQKYVFDLVGHDRNTNGTALRPPCTLFEGKEVSRWSHNSQEPDLSSMAGDRGRWCCILESTLAVLYTNTYLT